MTSFKIVKGFFASLLAGLLAVHAGNNAIAQPRLKDVFKDKFLVGAALNLAQFSEQDIQGAVIAKEQFNSITPENALKWEVVHPKPGKYDFAAADRFVEFGLQNRMFIVGHTLVWHDQTPGWVFEDSNGGLLNKEQLLERMRDHIHTIVGRYKGKIKGWDVVNEAIDDDGSYRQSMWMKIIGEEYLVKAFQYAHEADPEAELYYNDFSLENAPKRAGAIALIRKLQKEGITVSGVGLQGHYKMDWPSTNQIDSTISEFAALGVRVMITELDVDILPPADMLHDADVSRRIGYEEKLNPYRNGLPQAEQERLASRYAELFRVFVKNKGKVGRVTFWGVDDRGSWLNDWPVRGRTSYPLLFGRDGKPKPAFEAVVKTAL
jgi:endo-1,4-beta-xylanase